MWDEGEIRGLAADSHGLLDRHTLRWFGLTDRYIQEQLRYRRWSRAFPGVYYLNATPMTWEARVLAAVLAAGDEALASHRTAGTLLGLEGFRSRIIELTVPFSDRPIPEGITVHRTRRFLPASEAFGVPTTSVERTLLDLAAILPDTVLEKAAMSALRKSLTTTEAIALTLAEQGGRGVKGTKRLRRVLDAADQGMTGSVAEVEAAQIIRTAPIPSPIRQHRIRLPDGSNAYPDFSWPPLQKIVEVDGYAAHSTPEQLKHDLVRQNLLMDLGWEIRRFSVDRIRSEPGVVRSEIIQFIRD